MVFDSDFHALVLKGLVGCGKQADSARCGGAARDGCAMRFDAIDKMLDGGSQRLGGFEFREGPEVRGAIDQAQLLLGGQIINAQRTTGASDFEQTAFGVGDPTNGNAGFESDGKSKAQIDGVAAGTEVGRNRIGSDWKQVVEDREVVGGQVPGGRRGGCRRH